MYNVKTTLFGVLLCLKNNVGSVFLNTHNYDTCKRRGEAIPRVAGHCFDLLLKGGEWWSTVAPAY